VTVQPNIDVAEINRLIANKNHTKPGKLLRAAQPSFQLLGSDRIQLHADLNGIKMSANDRKKTKGEFCRSSVYRDVNGVFEFKDVMCYALLPITDWGALARHMREEHLRLPVKR
jgi:hypothetical protein